jgi:crotonobetainyl-CoA:carnitine CoA-transferase CaiB-like acyl-CoA transferase
MTGRPGDPLRAGASVNDIMGGMFGAIGVMAAGLPAFQNQP